MAAITLQQLENASTDAKVIEDFANAPADVNGTGTIPRRLAAPVKSLDKIVEELSEKDIGESAAALINQRMFRSGTIAERGPTPFQNYPNGLHYFVHDINPPRMFAYIKAGNRNPVGALVTENTWYGYYTPTEIKNLSIDFTGMLPAANISGLINALTDIANASAIKIGSFRAQALSGDASPIVEAEWAITGLLPTYQTVSWKGYTQRLNGGARHFTSPDWALNKPLFVFGNSLSDITDVTTRWSQVLAQRKGWALVSVARYSSDSRQVYRGGAVPLYVTLAGALPANGSVPITLINGLPIDGNNPAAFLTTGDFSVLSGMTARGYFCRGPLVVAGSISAPNGGSFAYSARQDPGATAISFDGPVLFIPEAALAIKGSTVLDWSGNNYFFSGVPNQYGDYTNPQMWVDMQARVALAQGQGCRYLILPVIPAAGTTPGDDWTARGAGTPYTAMESANARTEQLFPGLVARHADGRTLLKYLQDKNDGSAGDLADLARGFTPRSLRRKSDGSYDLLHLNAIGDGHVADFVDSALTAQALPPSMPVGTTLIITAIGRQIGTDTPLSDTALTRVVRDPIADLADGFRAVLTTSDYRETPEGGADLPNGARYISVDPVDNRQYRYRRDASNPNGYVRGRLFVDKSDAGLPLVENIAPDQMPFSIPQQTAVTAAINALLNGAPAALDTLKELADAIGDDANFSTTVTTALTNRVRVDINNQALTNDQKSNARANIGAPFIGDFDLLKSGFPRLEDWLAIGDGIADDTAAVQRALNSNEPVIYVPAKTFVCDALTLNSRKDLRSIAGRSGTAGGFPILKLANNASGDQLTIGVNGVLTISNMAFAGNRQNQAQPRSGIIASPRTDGVYSQCLIADRFLIRDYAGWVAKIGTNRNAVKLIRCLIQGGALGGISFDGSQDLSAFESEISFSEGPNVVFDTTIAASASHIMEMCRLYYAGHSYTTGAVVTPGIPSMLIKGANNRSLSFFDGQINSNTGEAIRIEATETISDQNFVFEGVEFNGNSKGAAGTYSNVYTATRNLRLDGHYAGYSGAFPVKHILEVAPALARVPISCSIGADASAYTVAYSNGAPVRGTIDQVQGEYSNNSATQIDMTIDLGKRHFDVILNVSSAVLTSSIGTEREGYHALVNIHAIASGKTLTVKKSTGSTSLTLYQPGLYFIVYRNGAWISTKLGLSSATIPDGGGSGNEFYSNTNGGTITAPVTARLINLQVGASATLEKLQMPIELEVQGVVLDLIVRNLAAGGVLHILKSSGTETTSVSALGTYRLIFTQGVWKTVKIGDVPA